jgi:hypothetical protein
MIPESVNKNLNAAGKKLKKHNEENIKPVKVLDVCEAN